MPKLSHPALLASITLSALLLSGCDRPAPLHVADGQAQGTSYHLKWWVDSDTDASDEAIGKAITHTLRRIDKALSTYRDDSWLAEFNARRDTDWHQAPASVIELLGIARQVNRLSGGCYDPTVGPLFRLWGFHDENFHVPDNAAIQAARTHIGLDKIEVDAERGAIRKRTPNVTLDVSSMGEGYTIEQLASELEAHGVTNYLVEMGGDLYAKGHKPSGKPWRVGVEVPKPDQLSAQRVFEIQDKAGVSLNTSGTYRRYFDDNGQTYGHVIDARTGRPVQHHLVSVSVFGQRPALTDAWATALLCLGPEEGVAAANQLDMPVYLIEKTSNGFKTHDSEALDRSTLIKASSDD
ncbi:FAD:protein FMN transferase [Larsenimonas suaedae]|uniref:FAD:protein FMN transferase n=1 Tax=Larsenimonas suaedae TaxID=1851019 RepID=A0ABU1GVL2_9GAMM|nr:FAD:protein FMN transferase [Larsenimonas suaedae]MCM2972043.1 FAD:protein FMN transferase [Larsenimonas suaedae]MDR5895596.1 FAD:protein FMN transferase [Larsenimonas suaedae]